MDSLATGPRTPEGKAKSAKNATRHGLLSRELLQRDERASHLRALTQRLMVELQPVGELELLLVERIVSCMWRLRRALRVEVEVLEYGRSDFQGEDEGLALTSWSDSRRGVAGRPCRCPRCSTCRCLPRLRTHSEQTDRHTRRATDGVLWAGKPVLWVGNRPINRPRTALRRRA